MTASDLSHALRDIAARVRRMPPPSHRKPNDFHENRSELAHEIDVLAQSLTARNAASAVPTLVWPQKI